MKIVISDTTAITSLEQIGHLDLLHDLYHEIIIPNAVYEELQIYHVALCKPWIRVEKVQNISLLPDNLDDGEAEAIALAEELEADLLIIDERKGYKEAEKRGIEVIGLLGILLVAKRKKLISSLKPILSTLKNIGFYIDSSLVCRVLEEAGE